MYSVEDVLKSMLLTDGANTQPDGQSHAWEEKWALSFSRWRFLPLLSRRHAAMTAHNNAAIDQAGNGNRSVSLQHGTGNSVHLVQQGQANQAYNIQYGSGNSTSVNQQGNSNFAIVTQVGSGNRANVNQPSAGQYLAITQVGTGLDASIGPRR